MVPVLEKEFLFSVVAAVQVVEFAPMNLEVAVVVAADKMAVVVLEVAAVAVEDDDDDG